MVHFYKTKLQWLLHVLPIPVQKYLIETWDLNFTFHLSLFAANLRDGEFFLYIYGAISVTCIFHINRQYYKCGRTMNNNKQPTSDWHRTSTIYWALTSEMIGIQILYCFVHRQHGEEKEQWLFPEEVNQFMDLKQPRVSRLSKSVS